MNKCSPRPCFSQPTLKLSWLHEVTKGSTVSALHRHQYPALISLFIRCRSTVLFIVWIQRCRQGSDGVFPCTPMHTDAHQKEQYAQWKHKIIDEQPQYQDKRKWIYLTFGLKNIRAETRNLAGVSKSSTVNIMIALLIIKYWHWYQYWWFWPGITWYWIGTNFHHIGHCCCQAHNV